MEYIIYHASVESFKEFDENKIRDYETDAAFNGFWFSSNEKTSSAWMNPKYLKTCEVTLNNPCTWDVIKEMTKDRFKYSCNELRQQLLIMGYDGIIVKDIPNINEKELQEKGETSFRTVRSTRYILKLEGEYLCLYDTNGVYIINYDNLREYLSYQDRIIVTFSNKNIKILEEIKNPYWN